MCTLRRGDEVASNVFSSFDILTQKFAFVKLKFATGKWLAQMAINCQLSVASSRLLVVEKACDLEIAPTTELPLI